MHLSSVLKCQGWQSFQPLRRIIRSSGCCCHYYLLRTVWCKPFRSGFGARVPDWFLKYWGYSLRFYFSGWMKGMQKQVSNDCPVGFPPFIEEVAPNCCGAYLFYSLDLFWSFIRPFTDDPENFGLLCLEVDVFLCSLEGPKKWRSECTWRHLLALTEDELAHIQLDGGYFGNVGRKNCELNLRYLLLKLFRKMQWQ